MARRFAWSSIHARLHIGRTGVDLQPKTAVLNATAEHRHSIFVFHGLGDSHDGYETLVEDWSQAMPAAKFIVPSAPDYAITQFGGQACPAWYDLTGSSNRDTEECEGLRESCDSIAPLIEEEVQVVGAENDFRCNTCKATDDAVTVSHEDWETLSTILTRAVCGLPGLTIRTCMQAVEQGKESPVAVQLRIRDTWT
eukprot:TRINITY_DN12498_c1_g12_i4.p1 TRINITY_DN12498_c1_g12~~TRINITY_DN12498_c1_g12_i4.p1  ORF type:complete len:196 (+),score=33.56 TRINITY_DN12498_c1_g12_i4:20-607(+)